VFRFKTYELRWHGDPELWCWGRGLWLWWCKVYHLGPLEITWMDPAIFKKKAAKGRQQ